MDEASRFGRFIPCEIDPRNPMYRKLGGPLAVAVQRKIPLPRIETLVVQKSPRLMAFINHGCPEMHFRDFRLH